MTTTNQFIINWVDSGRKPKQKPDPAYPKGIDLDCSFGSIHSCATPLPYPAIGHYVVECRICGLRVACTTAGRPDDPRSVKMACKRMTMSS